MKKILTLIYVSLLFMLHPAIANGQPSRIIMFGAHPDDCDGGGGGTAILLASMGHAVKFVSVTNGDAGHQTMGGGALAKRRMAEAAEAGKRFGVTYEVLDNHDGELVPSLDVRMQVIRKIREWNADVVIAPRPNDYHPDHRYTGVLVQDAAYMVTVPFFCPDVPAMKKNPVFMYYTDRFQKPAPSRADVIVNIDPVVERKQDALGVMISQFAEGGANGNASLYPADPAGQRQRQQQVREYFSRRFKSTTARFAKESAAWNPGIEVQHSEAFEICEYGTQPDREGLRKLFPFFK